MELLLSIIALIFSLISLIYSIYCTIEDNKRWNDYFNRPTPSHEPIIIESDKPFIFNQEEFNQKAQHILDTVVKPQVEKYEQRKLIEKLIAEDQKDGMYDGTL